MFGLFVWPVVRPGCLAWVFEPGVWLGCLAQVFNPGVWPGFSAQVFGLGVQSARERLSMIILQDIPLISIFPYKRPRRKLSSS